MPFAWRLCFLVQLPKTWMLVRGQFVRRIGLQLDRIGARVVRRGDQVKRLIDRATMIAAQLRDDVGCKPIVYLTPVDRNSGALDRSG